MFHWTGQLLCRSALREWRFLPWICHEVDWTCNSGQASDDTPILPRFSLCSSSRNFFFFFFGRRASLSIEEASYKQHSRRHRRAILLCLNLEDERLSNDLLDRNVINNIPWQMLGWSIINYKRTETKKKKKSTRGGLHNMLCFRLNCPSNPEILTLSMRLWTQQLWGCH